MVDWNRTSERHLFRLLLRSTNEQHRYQAYDELTKRLNRYLTYSYVQKNFGQDKNKQEKQPWQIEETLTILKTYQPDIVIDVIGRVFKYHDPVEHDDPQQRRSGLTGNSRQFRAYLQQVFTTVCAEYLKQARSFELSINEDIYTQKTSVSFAERLSLTINAHSSSPISIEWQQTQAGLHLLPPDIQFSEQESEHIIAQAQQALSADCQEILDDKHQHLSSKALAKKLGISDGNVRIKRKRCQEQFLKELIHTAANIDEQSLSSITISEAISQLPVPYQTVIYHWWHGQTSWIKLEEYLDGDYQQKEIKALVAEGLYRLYLIVSTIPAREGINNV